MSQQVIDEGEITNTRHDDSGELLCDVIVPGMSTPLRGVRLRLPMGLQARLFDTQREADALVLRDGPLAEVVTAVDRQATSELPKLESGQTRLHSLDPDPQLISILSTLIALGRNAKKGVVREDDKIDLGKIVFTFSVPAGTPPVFEMTIVYTDGLGSAPVTIGPVVIAGTGAPQPSYTLSLRGKAIDWSALVKSA